MGDMIAVKPPVEKPEQGEEQLAGNNAMRESVKIEFAVDENKILQVLLTIDQEYKSRKLEEKAERIHNKIEKRKATRLPRLKKLMKNENREEKIRETVRKAAELVLTEEETKEALRELEVIELSPFILMLGLGGSHLTGTITSTEFSSAHEAGHYIHYFVMKKAVENGTSKDPVLNSLHEKVTELGYGFDETWVLLKSYSRQNSAEEKKSLFTYWEFTEAVAETFATHLEHGMAYEVLSDFGCLQPHYWGALVASWPLKKVLEENPEQFRELLEQPSLVIGSSTYEIAKQIKEQMGLTEIELAKEWFNTFFLPAITIYDKKEAGENPYTN